jgi:Thaumatin family
MRECLFRLPGLLLVRNIKSPETPSCTVGGRTAILPADDEPLAVEVHMTRSSSIAAALVALITGVALEAGATSFTVRNNCTYTVYPGIFPAAVFENGGWTLPPGASSTFSVPVGPGRLWGRTGCNTSTSPAQCTTGSCGGTGLQCAGTTGQPNTSLFEWNVDAAGTDWYDVSYVDAVDNPIGVSVSNPGCTSPSTCSRAVIDSCPADLRSGAVCLSPCTRFGTDQFCCRGAYGTPQTCVVADWAAFARAYVDNVHGFCPQQYSYAYDEIPGDALHTCPTGAHYTVTFCP